MFGLESLSASVLGDGTTLQGLVLASVVSLILGLAVSCVYRFRNPQSSQSLTLALVLLPAMVQIIIMLVGSNIGAGVAVAGAFSLIRFRSVPGNARDIAHLFLSMSIGFVTGMGYLLMAVVFFLIVGSASLLLAVFQFAEKLQNMRTLRINIHENLDYEGLFDDLFEKYTHSAELQEIRTTQMGSLYSLVYTVKLKSSTFPKAFLDELRVRNGNLSITLGRERRGEDL